MEKRKELILPYKTLKQSKTSIYTHRASAFRDER